MIIYFAVLIFSNSLSLVSSGFTKDETNIFVSLMEHFTIKECLFSTDTKDFNVFKVAKTLTHSNRLYSFYCLSSDLIDLILTHGWNLKQEDWLFRDNPYGGEKRYLHPRSSGIIWKSDLSTVTQGLSQIEYVKTMRIFIWIIFLTFENLTERQLSEQLYCTLDCIFIVVIKAADGEEYRLYEIYKTHLKSKTYIKNFGFWNTEEGLKVDHTHFYRRRLNLEAETLKFYIYGNEFFRNSPALSSVYEIWCGMGNMMNFSHVVISKYKITPEEISMVYKLYQGYLTVFPLDSLTYTPDVVGPLWPYSAYMHVKYQSDQVTGLQILTRPFSKQVWMFIGLWLLVSTPLIVITEFFVVKYKYPGKIKSFSVLESIFSSIYPYLNHGRDDNFFRDITDSSIRLLHLLRWMKVVILLPIFTGAVVSFLTVTIPSLPFNNFNEFVGEGTYKLNTLKGTYVYNYYKIPELSETLHHKFLYKNYFVEESKIVTLMTEIPRILCSEDKIAFVGLNNEILDELSILADYGDIPVCRILKVNQPIFSFPTVMIVGSNTYLTKFFNRNLMQFRSSGVFQKLGEFLRTNGLQDSAADKMKQIDLKQCLPDFLLLGFGFTVSLIMFTCELLLMKKTSLFMKPKIKKILVKIGRKKLRMYR